MMNISRAHRAILSPFVRTALFLVMLLALSVLPAKAEKANGGYANPYLQIPLGARPAGMGGAYIALASDPAGIYYNPAGLTDLSRPKFGLSYRVLDLGRKLFFASALAPIQGGAVLGVHWRHAGSDAVPARDEDGDLLGNSLGENQNELGILFAKRFERFLSLGGSFSYVDATLAELKSNSVGIDVGIVLHLDQFVNREAREKLAVSEPRLGIVVRQLARKFTWNSNLYELAHTTSARGTDQTDNVPLEVGAGLSGKILEKKLLLDVDLVSVEHLGLDLRAGAEYAVSPEARLRLGYGERQFAAGAGYEFLVGKQVLRLDYAFSTNRAGANSEHVISFDFQL